MLCGVARTREAIALRLAKFKSIYMVVDVALWRAMLLLDVSALCVRVRAGIVCVKHYLTTNCSHCHCTA